MVPLETKSRHALAPDVAKLDALLPSNSNVGEDVTAALVGAEFPTIPSVTTSAPINRRVMLDLIGQDYITFYRLVQDAKRCYRAIKAFILKTVGETGACICLFDGVAHKNPKADWLRTT